MSDVVQITPNPDDRGEYVLWVGGVWLYADSISEIRDISNKLVAQVSYWERVERGMAEPRVEDAKSEGKP